MVRCYDLHEMKMIYWIYFLMHYYMCYSTRVKWIHDKWLQKACTHFPHSTTAVYAKCQTQLCQVVNQSVIDFWICVLHQFHYNLRPFLAVNGPFWTSLYSTNIQVLQMWHFLMQWVFHDVKQWSCLRGTCT